MTPLVTLTKHGNLGIVVLNNPPVNALSHGVRKALSELLLQAFADPSIAAVVLCCEGRTFIAGADIREFGKTPLPPDVPEVVELIDAATKPVIAALHGTALGGGLELALACQHRVALATTRVGFPEVTLGLLPGAGGTQRLPRLVGVGAALELIVKGKLISAAEAQALGLVDAVVEEPLQQSALAFAAAVLLEGRPQRRVSELVARLEAPEQLDAYRASIAEQSRGFLAPFHCIEAIRAAVELPFTEGLARERALFVELMDSPQSKAQRHAFFAEREVAKVPGLPEATATRTLRSAVVVGCGARARAIGACLADAALPVTLLASTREELDNGVAALRVSAAAGGASGEVDGAKARGRRGPMTCSLDAGLLKDADLIVEADAVDGAAQRAALGRIDAVAKPGSIVVTTSPYADIDNVAACTTRPTEVVGVELHQGGAARAVETIRAHDTAAEVSATLLKLVKSAGKLPVLVRGPVGSRMFGEYLREALFLLEEGALPEQVDRVLRDFGFQAGPFAECDRNGLEVEWQRRKLRFDSLHPRARACTLLDQICEQGRFGLRAGAGFYRYDADGNPTHDPAIEALVVVHSRDRGIVRRSISDQEILERCLFSLINEGARVLEEGVAARPLDIDMIWIHGYAFPVYHGGPMFHADQLGLARVCNAMLGYAAEPGGEHQTPAPSVERLAHALKGFYAAS